MRRTLAVLCTLAATTAGAKDPKFGFPLECSLGEDCYIQQYLDHDPGPEWNDFTCSTLSYDGHRGTDIALPTLADMKRGTNIVAAAPGKVLAVRDGMDDVYFTNESAAQIDGRDCGNRVAIGHGGGWITDYCHMKKGSVAVKKGDRVAMGAVLGQVGLSGRTQFPHLHFSVQHRGAHVDPFAPDGVTQCQGPLAKSLWLEKPTYEPGGIIDVGFAPGVPEYQVIKAGAQTKTFEAEADAAVFWVYAFGLRKDDQIRYGFDGPGGVKFENTAIFDRNQALVMRSGGKRRKTDTWPRGTYNGSVDLIRDGAVFDSRSYSFTLN